MPLKPDGRTVFRLGHAYHLIFSKIPSYSYNQVPEAPCSRQIPCTSGTTTETVRAAWDADRQLLLVLRQTCYPNPAGCLQRGSGSCYHLTTALTSLKSIQPQAPSSIFMGQRGLPELPAAQPRGSKLQSCYVSDPDCQG